MKFSQQQIWSILQGVSSQGVYKTLLAWYGKYKSPLVRVLIKEGRIPLLSVNGVGEKLKPQLVLVIL